VRQKYQDGDRPEPLPTDGLDVEEFRDADTQRLFMLEWRRRLVREAAEQGRFRGRTPRPRAMTQA
jgi:hypothetical protein